MGDLRGWLQSILVFVILMASAAVDVADGQVTPGKPAQKRVALVVGMSAYNGSPWAALKNPDSDADFIAQRLHEKLDFELIGGGPLRDATQTELESAIKLLLASAGPDTITAFYYAGHGLKLDGRTQLVPIDASRRGSSPFIDLESSVTKPLQDAGAQLVIIMVDACRNELPVHFTKNRGSVSMPGASVPAGLSERTITVFSTEANDDAKDNSPFAQAVGDFLIVPGLDIRAVFENAADDVFHMTHYQQRPTIEMPLTSDRFYLAGVAQQTASTTSGSDNDAHVPSEKNGQVRDTNGVFSNHETQFAARQELASIGVQWGDDRFYQALSEHDYQAVELFLKGGMLWSDQGEFESWLRGPFDNGIATLLLRYNEGNSLDGLSLCRTPILWSDYDPSLNTTREGALFLNNGDVMIQLNYQAILGDQNRVKFLRAVCSRPEVIKRIREQKTRAETELTKKKDDGSTTYHEWLKLWPDEIKSCDTLIAFYENK